MKAKTKFLKWYYKFPKSARGDLVWKPYSEKPMSLNSLWIEIHNNTKLGEELLTEMRFKDES